MNQEIITKAIQKAIDNGWARYDSSDIETIVDGIFKSSGAVMDGPFFLSGLIFNRDFAKALWGDKFINPEHRDDTGSKVIAFKRTPWKYHLQQMVIAEDPIKYLGEHL